MLFSRTIQATVGAAVAAARAHPSACLINNRILFPSLVPITLRRHHIHTTPPIHKNTNATNATDANDHDRDPVSLHDRGISPSPETLSVLLSQNTRPYFYFIDIHGQVFLQDTTPKNFTSCYKDMKFLNFFLTRIRANTTPYFREEYAWQSPCGKEINFVEAADTPIVFHGLVNKEHLVWAGNLQTPFLPDKLSVSLSTGRIYHPLPPVMVQACSTDKDGNPLQPLGLLKSSLVLTEFAAHLDIDSFLWQGKEFPVHHVP
ncbi:MAG: hypothetical protein J3R72DRAFT_458923 [Linnemannia gamsii]|nr:MAG: hypothetical protein J3R72DRAFT_458923 [Linnemannia gamsii]